MILRSILQSRLESKLAAWMSIANSPPRREAASSPLPRRYRHTDVTETVPLTLSSLQFRCRSCSRDRSIDEARYIARPASLEGRYRDPNADTLGIFHASSPPQPINLTIPAGLALTLPVAADSVIEADLEGVALSRHPANLPTRFYINPCLRDSVCNCKTHS
jgi:hypothetical protein